MSTKKYEFLSLGTVNAPYMPALEAAVEGVLHSGRYIGGPEVSDFEHKLAAICGCTHAIGVSNGLDALRLILRGYIETGVFSEGDEIIVPANTYIASVLAISDARLVPVLVDADEATSNLDTTKALAAITSRTKGIMPVHLYGRICWDENLEKAATQLGLKIIEDNAQAIGARSSFAGLNGSHTTGSLGHAAAFSFYPTKNIGALGDAGAVTTSDTGLAEAVRALANYGSDTRYHNIYRGVNCRLDPIQAAILNVKLDFLEQENARRRVLAEIYGTHINNPSVRLPRNDGEACVWHQYVVHTADRKQFTDFLDANGIGWDMHYATPPHMQPCYSRADSRELLIPASLEVTERLAAECVSLPVSACTSPEDAHEIAGIINSFKAS